MYYSLWTVHDRDQHLIAWQRLRRSSQVGPLLDQIDDPIVQVSAGGAYDGAPTYQTIERHGYGIEVVIPPRETAVAGGELDISTYEIAISR
jgi:hypothetical protein